MYERVAISLVEIYILLQAMRKNSNNNLYIPKNIS